MCRVDNGWVCRGVPSVCTFGGSMMCGDGIVNGIEQCDDNNGIVDDGCVDCRV